MIKNNLDAFALKPEHFYTDGGKDFRSNHLQQIGVQLGFVCHLRDRPSEGGIVEGPFKTLNTELFSTLEGYTGSNVQERPEEVEKEACLTLQQLEQILVAYIVHNYNHRMGKPTSTPTLRWVFQCFMSIHLVTIAQIKQIANLTHERQWILQFFGAPKHNTNLANQVLRAQFCRKGAGSRTTHLYVTPLEFVLNGLFRV
ncbi:integrase [Nostoc commune NIES-4072]|uniref:Integrase n=1 Tax=Nostoc commune NIES-4072 TaxID=2005467 RepID=A0A2R5FEQ3_NOSCO|nr:integrase [Nostoc commune HK-02]GBG16926.1 integrase [Nostoc commune NIES-4072]